VLAKPGVPRREPTQAVLIVEGDQAAGGDFAAILGTLGVEVHLAPSTGAALGRLAAREYAALLVGLEADGADAAKLAAATRRRGGANPTPMIFIGGDAPGGEGAEEAYELGAVDHLPSPVDPAILRGKVSLFLELARLRAGAATDDTGKSRFLSMVAHELRAPLGVAAGYVSMIQEGTFGPLAGGLGSAVDIVSDKVGEIQQLVEDLLTASRLEGGELQLRLETLDLDEAVAAAIGRIRPRAAMVGASIEYEESSGNKVTADQRYLSRILDNLLNNALSYSEGAPWIRVSLDGDDPRTVTIEDHGIGILPEMRDQVFRRGTRANDADARRPGTGLGLYVSRGLAEQLRGSLQLLDSVAGVGSTFELSLPATA